MPSYRATFSATVTGNLGPLDFDDEDEATEYFESEVTSGLDIATLNADVTIDSLEVEE